MSNYADGSLRWCAYLRVAVLHGVVAGAHHGTSARRNKQFTWRHRQVRKRHCLAALEIACET